MSIAAGATILAGLILYGLDARAGEAWLRSSFAIGLGVGAVFAFIGFIFGIMIGRTTKAMAQLGAQMQGKPSPDQVRQMQAIQKQQGTYSTITAAALIRPEKQLALVGIKSLRKRFKEPSFAKGARREDILTCVELGLELEEFMAIGLEAMQEVSDELGL